MTHVATPGFTHSERPRTANPVLGQRGGLRKLEPGIGELPCAWQALARRLAVRARAGAPHPLRLPNVVA